MNDIELTELTRAPACDCHAVAQCPDDEAGAPLVKGGQGRTAESLQWSALELLIAALSLGAILGVCLAAALLKK